MLRDYQIRAREELREMFRRHRRRLLLVAPTGAGKTTIAADLIGRAVERGHRVWFVAHRRELISQCSARLDAHGLDHGIIQADHPRHRPEQPIQVASIQTLVRRTGLETPGLVIVDEAHRARARTYLEVLEQCACPVVGLTATPLRADGQPLNDGLFEDLVIVAQPRDLIESGHLLKPRMFSVVPKGLESVPMRRGDYDDQALGQLMSRAVANSVAEWAKFKSRRTVAFAASVEHSKNLVAAFQNAGVVAEHVDATTPKLERDAILARIRNGQSQVVSNVGILTEGWDLPELDCVLIDRPTKSLSLYLQMVGRGMRPCEGKGEFLLLDNGGCYAEHGLPYADREWSLDGRPKSKMLITRQCPQCFAVIEGRPETCPQCGHVFEAQDKPEEKHIEGTLAEVDSVADDRHDELVRLYRKAAEKGYRRGWVQHRFRARFDDEPTTQECARARRVSSKSVSSNSARSQASESGGGTLEQRKPPKAESFDSGSEVSPTSQGSLDLGAPSLRSNARPRKDAPLWTRNDGSQWSDHMEAVHSWYVQQSMRSIK